MSFHLSIFQQLQKKIFLFFFKNPMNIYYLVNIFLYLIPVNRQINDKERIAAAMENPRLRELVTQCVEFEAL